jgi:hypothetical protein
VSYERLDEQARVASANLRRRIGPEINSRIALVAGTDVESAIVLLGAMHSVVDTLLIDEATTQEKRTALIRAFQAGLVVASRRCRDSGTETVTFQECPVPVEEGVTSFLASLCVGSTHHSPHYLREFTLPSDNMGASGAWIIGDQADALADHPLASRWLEALDWIYLSVDPPLAARRRRRIARLLRTPILTVLGTPTTVR